MPEESFFGGGRWLCYLLEVVEDLQGEIQGEAGNGSCAEYFSRLIFFVAEGDGFLWGGGGGFPGNCLDGIIPYRQ